MTVTNGQARAVEDPMRSKIVTMLYGQELSADQIVVAIKRAGFEKTGSTVRHHLKILRDAGMVDVTKVVESRGGVTKYYGTSTRLLNFEGPENFEVDHADMIDGVAERLGETVGDLYLRVSGQGGRQPAGHPEYMVVEIVNRAVTKILEQNQIHEKKRPDAARRPRSNAKKSASGRNRKGSTTDNAQISQQTDSL